jgi:hypothetical protein
VSLAASHRNGWVSRPFSSSSWSLQDRSEDADVLCNAHELSQIGWNATAEDLPAGVKLTVTNADPKQVPKLKALGFMGIMVLGAHHQSHHLMMAKGEFNMH